MYTFTILHLLNPTPLDDINENVKYYKKPTLVEAFKLDWARAERCGMSSKEITE